MESQAEGGGHGLSEGWALWVLLTCVHTLCPCPRGMWGQPVWGGGMWGSLCGRAEPPRPHLVH